MFIGYTTRFCFTSTVEDHEVWMIRFEDKKMEAQLNNVLVKSVEQVSSEIESKVNTYIMSVHC